MTPCEKLGYKVGDRFKAIEEDVFSEGSIVELYKDDGSGSPLFKLIEGYCEYNNAGGKAGGYEGLENVTKIEGNKYKSTVKEENKQMKSDVMYQFNISAPEAINFTEILNELSRENPIVRVEFKDVEKVKQIKELKKELQRVEFAIKELQKRDQKDTELELEAEDIKYDIKEISDVYTYYVVVHDSIIDKAEFLNIIEPGQLFDNVAALEDPKEYSDWISWVKEVKAAQYDGPKGVVTVTKLKV